MDTSKLIDELERDEGLRLKVYRDSVGIETIGIGRNLRDRGITREEAYYMIHHDIEDVEASLDQRFPWWRTLDDVRQRVVANMCFNLGIERLSGFHNTLELVRVGQYNQAAANMLTSKWAEQVKERAQRLAKMMATGVALTLCLMISCTTQVKQQAKVDVAENIEATDADREMGEMTGEEETTTKAERRESRQPTTLELEVVDTKYGPDGGVAATKKKTFKKTTGQVDINSDKTEVQSAKTKADVQKQDDKKVVVTDKVAAEESGEKKTGVGPGWKFYFGFVIVGIVALILIFLYLKFLRGPL